MRWLLCSWLVVSGRGVCLNRMWIGVVLLLALSAGRLWAQNAIYSWTDEKGVVHFSDSMVPPQHLNHAEKVDIPSRPAYGTVATRQSDSIPLVILNGDPSQKFVRTVLEGERATREVLMLVDTGAQITVIDEALANELEVEHVQDAMIAGVTGTARSWIGRLPTLRLGEERVSDLQVMIGPMAGRLLLGMDVLEQLELSVGPRSLHRAQP